MVLLGSSDELMIDVAWRVMMCHILGSTILAIFQASCSRRSLLAGVCLSSGWMLVCGLIQEPCSLPCNVNMASNYRFD